MPLTKPQKGSFPPAFANNEKSGKSNLTEIVDFNQALIEAFDPISVISAFNTVEILCKKYLYQLMLLGSDDPS